MPLRRDRVFLAGFMGTGKSTVARLLARELGRDALDLDMRIEERLGMEIPEIFAKLGEKRFREEESRELARVARGPASVVALGGGALIRPRNRALARSRGFVIVLRARPEEILRRVWSGRRARPLLAGLSREECLCRIRSLLRARAAAYRSARLAVRTDGRKPVEVAGAILRSRKFREWRLREGA